MEGTSVSRIIAQVLFLFSSISTVSWCRELQVQDVQYGIAGESITLPCSAPNRGDFLKWRFQPNGSTVEIDAAQSYPGGIVTVFDQFNLPPGRSGLINGMFTINQLSVKDEGVYWCEIAYASAPSTFTGKTPVHIWVAPSKPEITAIGDDSVLENTSTSVARCSSRAGKPESKLTWMNGSVPLVTSAIPVVSKNPYSDILWDVSLNLILENPTRFDHLRLFECVIEHPAYKGESRSLQQSVQVLYHPVNIRIWANLTSLMVYCEADGYPEPKYSWIIPGNLDGFTSPFLQVADLYSLPGYERFECTADNGIPEPATAFVLVDDLRWPDGKPQEIFAGLPVYVWAAIGVGTILLIVTSVVVICCYCKKKKKGARNSVNKKRKTSNSTKYCKPIVDISGTRHSQPSLLEFDSVRASDRIESIKNPIASNGSKKSSLARACSLEDAVEDKYGGSVRDSVMLVPLNQMLPRGSLYAGRNINNSNFNQGRSRENISKVLNNSWDNLAHSREQLDRSRDELKDDLPPRYDAYDDYNHSYSQYGSQRSNDQDSSYRYDEDALHQHDDRLNNQESYHQNHYRGNYTDQPHSYDINKSYQYDQHDEPSNSNYGRPDYLPGSSSFGKHGYDGNHGSTSRYDDEQYDSYEDSSYNQHRHENHSRDSRYGDEFDDEDHNYEYDSRASYQHARMV